MDASKITPWLWVGRSPANAGALKELRDALGLTGVLNVQTRTDMRAGRFDLPERELAHVALGITLAWVPIVDLDQASLVENLARAVDALEDLRTASKTPAVFVHCSAGVERSPTVVAAHLSWRMGHDLDDAVRIIRAARPIAAPRVSAILAAREASGGRRPA